MTTSCAINKQPRFPNAFQGKVPPLAHLQFNITSELSLLYSEKNKDSEYDKDIIVKKLHRSLQTSREVEVEQFENLFEDEKSMNVRSYPPEFQRKSYQKFPDNDVRTLKANFEKNNYPDLGEMKIMASRFGVGLLKVENWYKHHRRSLAKHGQFDIKTKKHFKNLEVNYLMEIFQEHPKPTLEQIKIVAKKLNCTNYQIKNWFSNKRKKLRFFIPDQEALPQIEVVQQQLLSLQTEHPSQGPNPMSNLSTLLSSYFKARSSIISQIDANNQRIQDIQHLRAQFANFSSNQNYIQENSRSLGIQANIYPSNFFGSIPVGRNNVNSTVSAYSFPDLNLNKPSQLHLLQTEARNA